jgi:hypothetical protein
VAGSIMLPATGHKPLAPLATAQHHRPTAHRVSCQDSAGDRTLQAETAQHDHSTTGHIAAVRITTAQLGDEPALTTPSRATTHRTTTLRTAGD